MGARSRVALENARSAKLHFALEYGHFQAIRRDASYSSRWLSEATPPDEHRTRIHPEGMAARTT